MTCHWLAAGASIHRIDARVTSERTSTRAATVAAATGVRYNTVTGPVRRRPARPGYFRRRRRRIYNGARLVFDTDDVAETPRKSAAVGVNRARDLGTVD